MTLKYFCDRCDTECNSEDASRHAHLIIDPYPRPKKRPFNITLDLCPICYKHFLYFMKQNIIREENNKK